MEASQAIASRVKTDIVSGGDFMATLFGLLGAVIIFLTFFYSTTIMMSYLYALDSAPLVF